MSAIASVAPPGPVVIASQRTHGNFDTSQTTSASEQKLAHILVIAQEYNLCAWLFHISLGPDYCFLGKDAKGRLPCEKGLEDCLTPGPLARFFTRRVVGTAEVAGIASSRFGIATSPGARTSLRDFREDFGLSQGFRSVRCFLDDLESNAGVKLDLASEHVTNAGLQTRTAFVIKNVLDKSKVASCLLVVSTLALAGGIVLGVLFPQADIGSSTSTATIALACLLQACIAWCQY